MQNDRLSLQDTAPVTGRVLFSNFGNAHRAHLETNGRSFPQGAGAGARNGAADLGCAGGTGSRCARARDQGAKWASSPATCCHTLHGGRPAVTLNLPCARYCLGTSSTEVTAAPEELCQQAFTSMAGLGGQRGGGKARDQEQAGQRGQQRQALRPTRRGGGRELCGGRAPDPPTDKEASDVRDGACRLLRQGVGGGPGAAQEGWGRARETMGVSGPAQAWRPRPGPTAAASLRLRDWTRPGAERVEKAARPSLRDTQGTRAPLGPERGCGACTRPPPASAPSHWPSSRPHLLFQEAPVFEQLPVVRQCALFGFHCHLARGHKNTKP